MNNHSAPDERRHLEEALIEGLVWGKGMNDFLHRFLQAIAGAFSITHAALYSFHQASSTFEVMYFLGYHGKSRSDLRKRLHRMNMERAIQQREPYWSDDTHRHLLVPLYFQDTLEAVLILESANNPLQLDAIHLSVCQVLAPFLGLFLSSSRMPRGRHSDLVTVSDLERAREVQMSYLPSEHPVTDRYEIYGYNQSSALVGGDYFDYFRQREKTIQCVIADACGHGMAAALIMSAFRAFLHSEVFRLEDLSSLYTDLNAQIYSGRELIQYLTTVFFEYLEETQEIRYLNAGHFEPLLVHSDGTSSHLPGGGPPLGMFQHSTYEPTTAGVRQGDILVLFTDGLVELRNARDDFFGVEGILQAVADRRQMPLRDMAKGVLAAAASFSHKAEPDDDLTLFLMRFR
ncbi:MAG: PP2C family protein-serine/threonine phosphatase [Acidobacteriota bacterium]|jgi:serine phosphatase RsbU (regulator of sigma subunit)